MKALFAWVDREPEKALILGMWVVLPLVLGTLGILCWTLLIAIGRVQP